MKQCMAYTIVPSMGKNQILSMSVRMAMLADDNFKRIRRLARTVMPFL